MAIRSVHRLRLALAAASVLALLLLAPSIAAAATTATTGPATNVTSTSATLTGSVTVPSSDAAYAFQYGTTTNYGQFAPATPKQVGAGTTQVSQTVTGLQPNTTYHYRLVSEDASTDPSTAGLGQDATFTTTAATPPPPPGTASAVTGPATAGRTTLTLSATIDTSSSADYAFQYGTSTAYGKFTPVQTATAGARTVTAQVSGLLPGTTYHYRIVLAVPTTSAPNYAVALGADRTARTTSPSPPSLRLRSSRVAVSGRRASVALACGSGSGRCHGRVSLSAAGGPACGSASYSAAASRSFSVRIALSARCASRLAAARSHRLAARVTATTAGHGALRRGVTLAR
jgi:phosphodiesterase/alkaline phosphatase D-like protein